MNRHEEYAARHAHLRGMLDALIAGMPDGPLGFLDNYRIVEARKYEMLCTLPASEIIAFGMYNSYHRCRMN